MTAVALESGYWSALGEGVGAILLYAVVGLALMLVGFYAVDLSTPGQLRRLVAEGKPNAIIVTAAGLVSMAFIVVLAIYSSAGKLAEGLIAALVFGLVGIVAQIVSVRVLERAFGIDIGAALHSETRTTEVLVVAAAHFALGLVVAVAIL
ncbi:DUF350 domain-containing protein [Nocardia farcinica]|uniref:DUF350 domain-containing protein n=2 Tax=Nocardia farcinica TaxID=37329 RepID=Q5YS22_NOCFA|nr:MULTISPECIES: DUF350 domain-containing protein [Nocardia]SLI31108.1 integral membrane protein [Mycobacteroides abscessus subsp. abscessus]AXK88403.1 DUF350 domain-containing protein [Nocardia farcinica]MBA4857831.1 DUF350 domain-containing protein [Nocardia farcinica]MBC9815312.1 DUF350 domain-containing protein [Nocardia farcinica]MBF6071454.1 DUF350 domain-containing protein [Nocardia farcinica]